MKISWMISLIGLSMIGLISFQLYWINGMVRANEERFKKDVLEALNNVAGKLEKQEAIAAYNKLSHLNKREARKIKRKKKQNAGRREKSPQFKDTPQSILANRQQEVFMYQDILELGDNLQMVINFSSVTHSSYYPAEDDQETIYQKLNEQREKEIAALENRLARISRKYKLTLNVVKDLIVPKKPLASRFDPSLLDTLLSAELKSKGITIDYDYGVIEPSHDQYVLLAGQNAKSNLDKSTLRAALFPNDVLYNDSYLVIDFPEERSFLISKIWPSLLISSALVAVILFCFGYSIRMIVRQKKLSEMKNDFINNMTHELKTPISTISLAVEALNDKDVENSSLRDRYMKIINEENKRLSDQVEKVLQIAEIDKKDSTLQEEELLSMNELVRGASNQIAIQVEKTGRQSQLN